MNNPNDRKTRKYSQNKTNSKLVIIAALRSRCGHYIFVLFLSFFLLFFPCLSGRRMDVYHTSTHDAVLVRI